MSLCSQTNTSHDRNVTRIYEINESKYASLQVIELQPPTNATKREMNWINRELNCRQLQTDSLASYYKFFNKS